MKSVAFISVIMTGYVGMSFGILKIFWRQFGAHFYAHGVSHAPQAGAALDWVLISLIIVAGLSLVMIRAVVPALIILIAAFFVEFGLFHGGHHSFWQYVFVIGAISGQFITLSLYVLAYVEPRNGHYRRKPMCPSKGRPLNG